jgi:phenylpyruvate tautomerase PptA (4-oxalocrotonate tautomerase family)
MAGVCSTSHAGLPGREVAVKRFALLVPILLATFVIACSSDNKDQNITGNAAVLSRVTEALQEKNHWDPESVEVTLDTVVDQKYASGGVRDVPAGGGGLWFAALVGGDWLIVWDGNGVIDCSSLDPYPDFPVSLIAQCYNPSDGSLTDRAGGSSASPTKEADLLTVEGIVADVALSAKVVMLNPPVSGITSVAITDETSISFADGRQAQLQDIERGAVVKASGSAGSPGSLLAREVVIQ